MRFPHKSVETVKAYLLGTLSEREADLLEDRYFVDPAYFRYVREVEQQLAGDYQAGRLSSEDRARFESRYGNALEISTLLDSAVAAKQTRKPRRHQWILVAGACLAVCIVIVAVMLPPRRGHERAAGGNPIPIPPPALTVYLTPGVAKAAGPDTSFRPPRGGRVNLIFELPGQTQAINCRVVLAVVDSDGGRQTIWSSGLMVSKRAPTGGQIAVSLESALLRSADYLARLDAEAGGTLYTYVFRVNPIP